jgi:hypothetical protein
MTAESDADVAADTRWWTHPFAMLQTNLREIDAGLDVEQTLDDIQRHGADTWLLSVGGILAFHPSDLDFQTRNPWLAQRPGGDLVGDAVRAAHRRGMRLMARMDFSKVAEPIANAHPEWCFRSAEGRRQTIHGLVSVCPNGDYYQDRTVDIIEEVLDRYPVDGFFFNWFGFNEIDYTGVRWGVCHCDRCIAEFAAASGGAELPDGPESATYPQWRAFCRQVLDDLTGRIRNYIAGRRPDAALILGKRSDIVFHEANNKIGRELWPHATAEAVSAAKTARPEAPVLVNATMFVDIPYRMAAEDPEHVAQYFVQAIARGANPSTYLMGPTGAIRYDGLPAAGEITRFHRRHRSVYDGLRPAAPIALVRPDPAALAADDHDAAVEEFRGWYSALQQGHLPFDVLGLEQLAEAGERGVLNRFDALVLPDLGEVGDSERRMIMDNGGRPPALIITGSTRIDQQVVLAEHRGFAATRSSYATDGDRLLPVYGSLLELELPPGAECRYRLVPQAPFAPPEKAYGHRESQLPAIMITRPGGRPAVRIAWTIGRTFREFGTAEVRRVMADAVRDAVGPVITDGSALPEQLELIIGRNHAGLVIHLINVGGARRRGFAAPVPIDGARLRLPADIGTRVRSLVTEGECPTMRDDTGLTVELPRIELFEVLTVTP